MLAHHRATEEDLWRGARRDGAAHVVRQEREADLVCGCGRDLREVGTGGNERRERRTVHPAEPFAGHHLEIDALIAVLSVDEVRESHRVVLLGYHAVEVDERSRHPVPQYKVSNRKGKEFRKRHKLTCKGNDKRGAGHPRDSHSAQVLPTS